MCLEILYDCDILAFVVYFKTQKEYIIGRQSNKHQYFTQSSIKGLEYNMNQRYSYDNAERL